MRFTCCKLYGTVAVAVLWDGSSVATEHSFFGVLNPFSCNVYQGVATFFTLTECASDMLCTANTRYTLTGYSNYDDDISVYNFEASSSNEFKKILLGFFKNNSVFCERINLYAEKFYNKVSKAKTIEQCDNEADSVLINTVKKLQEMEATDE